MNYSNLNSLYVIQTQVVGLDLHPFPKAKLLRPVWRKIFCNPQCFTDQRQLIRDASSYFKESYRLEFPDEGRNSEQTWNMQALNSSEELDESLSLPDIPFIRFLGSICFNTRRIHTGTYYERQRLGLEFLRRGSESRSKQNDDDDESWILGYDFTLPDQRMNYLCFELSRPLVLHAKTYSDIRANGKIFIHIYPCGYLVIHLAISLTWNSARSLPAIRETILKETRPHHLNSKWIWTSRLSKEGVSLNSLTKRIYREIEASIFIARESKLYTSSQWRTLIRTTSEKTDSHAISRDLLGSHSDPKIIEDLSLQNSRSGADKLIVTRQGITCSFRPFSAEHKELYKSYSSSLTTLIGSVHKQLALTSLTKEDREKVQKFIVDAKPLLLQLKDKPANQIAYQFNQDSYGLIRIPWELREKERSGLLSDLEQKRLQNLRELCDQIREVEYLVRNMHASWSRPQSARRFLWKIARIQEFVLIKEKIYEDYVYFIQNEVHQLKKYRRSLKSKITEEEVFRTDVFDQKTSDFLQALDRHIQQASGFHRFIYSILCDGTKVNDHRHKVCELLKEWDDEAQKWEHPTYAAWKKLVQPLRAILASTS